MEGFSEVSMLYPLKFEPIYQERIWGGDQLQTVLKRQLPETDQPIGESWELSDREEACSRVVNGPMAGRTLHELVTHFGRALLGRQARRLDRFPLLVKLIDAGERLSLQVHPDEAAARRIGGGAEAKTEMWYVMSARRDARILAGLLGRATKQQLVADIASPTVENFLQSYPSQPGDAYFITAGTLHAIGGGNLILEIQQNSDTTYRVSDWGRVDAAGRSRELHVEQGMQAIDFTNRVSPRIAGVVGATIHNRKFDVVVHCPFFQVSDLHLVDTWSDNTREDSFHLLSAINAPVLVGKPGIPERQTRIEPGETVLVPAAMAGYVIEPLMAGETRVVKTTL